MESDYHEMSNYSCFSCIIIYKNEYMTYSRSFKSRKFFLNKHLIATIKKTTFS